MSTTSPLPERDNQQKQTAAERMTKVTERTIAFVIDASASRASSESEGKCGASITTNRLLVSRPSKNIRVHDVNRCA